MIKRDLKGKLIALGVAPAIFVGLQALSVTALKDVYLFEWLARARYCYVWAAVVVLILFDQTLISYCVTFRTLCGAFVGQNLGDYIKARNIAKITPDMSNEMKYHLSYHYGAFIFAIVVLSFTALGIICKLVIAAKLRRESRLLSQKDG